MAGGAVVLKDMADDEEGEIHERTIYAGDTGWVDIHAGREARWHAVDVLGSRPIVVLSVLKRVLCANGFAARLVWGRPDMRRRIFRSQRPERCELERQQMLTGSHLQTLGFERPDSEPLMTRWAASACHAAIVDSSLAPEAWVHGWDAEHPALLAQLYVEWEVPSDCKRTYMALSHALEKAGPQAVVMYLLSTRYGELLPPLREGLAMARGHVNRIGSTLCRLRPEEPSPPELAGHVQAFEDALSDDLDTPSAFLCLFDWIREARALRHPAGDCDLRRMLWLLGMTPPPQPAGPPERRGGSSRGLVAAGRTAAVRSQLSDPPAQKRGQRDMRG